MKKSNSIFIVLLSLLLLSACRGGNSDNKKTTDSSFETSADIIDLKKALVNIYFLFPSPAEILFTINDVGLIYISNLTNSAKKKEMYIKSNEKYLNLGVYMADLSYCALFKRLNEVEEYLEAIKRLSDELRLSSKVKKELIEKIKEDVNSIDSIKSITNQFFFDVINDLEANNRQSDVTLITTGAYVECLYLTVNQVDKYSKDNLIVQKIAEQKHAFNILYQYSKKHISKKELAQSYSLIKEVNDAFWMLSQEDEELEITNDTINHIIIDGGGVIISSEAEFMSFKEKITKIRNTITKQTMK
ncbi:MAG: hypothetical protein EHM93_11785 [Bacteroidales bacterium]|nr:MAG: hypothetical protein EHM93_11785 [Bacteroidales bacterium]